MFDVEKLRNDFPILKRLINSKPLVYLDNAATSQKPQVVIDTLVKYYTEYNSNIHRGIHNLSEESTSLYEDSKNKVRKFLNAHSTKEIIYTRNTTEAINLIAYSWANRNLTENDSIILSEMEHHSNIVIWQLLSEKIGFRIKYIPVKRNYTLDIDKYKEFLKLNPKLVSVIHSSNVLGTINDIKTITRLAHETGSLVLIDGAQSAPNIPIDLQKLDCDFFVFSSHKMCGPTGIGVLYAKKDILSDMPPFLAGGDMIKTVTYEKSIWNKLPWKFEAGTPNIADAIAFGTAIDYLEKLDLAKIQEYETKLMEYALDNIKKVRGLKIFGPISSNDRGGAISFTMENAHPHDIAEILNNEGIAIRSGNHCAQPLHNKFGIQSSARASIYFYNTEKEIEKLVKALEKVNSIFS